MSCSTGSARPIGSNGGTKKEKGFFRPSLMTEVWIVLLLYGGRVMDNLPLLERRSVRGIFGWTACRTPRHSVAG